MIHRKGLSFKKENVAKCLQFSVIWVESIYGLKLFLLGILIFVLLDLCVILLFSLW